MPPHKSDTGRVANKQVTETIYSYNLDHLLNCFSLHDVLLLSPLETRLEDEAQLEEFMAEGLQIREELSEEASPEEVALEELLREMQFEGVASLMPLQVHAQIAQESLALPSTNMRCIPWHNVRHSSPLTLQAYMADSKPESMI